MFTTLCKVEIFRSLTFISLSLSTFVYLCLNWKFMIFERPPVPAQGWEFTNCIYNSNHTCFTIVIVIVILLFKIPTTHVSQLIFPCFNFSTMQFSTFYMICICIDWQWLELVTVGSSTFYVMVKPVVVFLFKGNHNADLYSLGIMMHEKKSHCVFSSFVRILILLDPFRGDQGLRKPS